MGTRADELIEGPRGRRMLYNAATAADPELHRFAWDVQRSFEPPGSGAGYVSAAFGWGRRVDPELALRHDGAQSVAELAARLADDAAGYRLDAAVIDQALADSVAQARYWQEPDEADLMLADAAFDAPLLALAERVAADPAVAWWWQPCAVEQFAVQWHLRDDTSGEVRPPEPLQLDRADWFDGWAQRQRTAEDEAEALHTADPDTRRSGAWWTLPHFAGAWTTGAGSGVPAGLDLVEDAMSWQRAEVTPVTAAAGSRVLEIATPQDWVGLCARHPFEVTASRRQDWARATGREGRWVIPDWSAVASAHDAVHVSVAAYLTAAGRALPVGDGAATLLAGWDPDATVWLADLLEASGPAVSWRYDGDAWLPAP